MSASLGSRPVTEEIDIRDPGPTQRERVAARLWQDPIAAVFKSLDDLTRKELQQHCSKKKFPESTDPLCASPLHRVNDPSSHKVPLVLGVMMSGASYAEDFERRRRTRYAVLAGLEAQNFVPRDAQHISVFHVGTR